MEQFSNLEDIDPKLISEYIYNLDQEPDWWTALLWKYLNLGNETKRQLQVKILTDPKAWNETVDSCRGQIAPNIKRLILSDNDKWNEIIQQMLSDEIDRKLFEHYIKNLVMFKNKKVTDIGSRAQTKQRINRIYSVVADETLSNIEALDYAEEHLGKMPRDRESAGRKYYEEREKEEKKLIAILLGINFIFRGASANEDIGELQAYIEAKLIIPFELQKQNIKEPSEIKKISRKNRIL